MGKTQQRPKTTTLNCVVCQAEFERPTKEVRRSIKLNRQSYCSLSCAGKANKYSLGEHLGRGTPGKAWGKRWTKDKLAPFRYFHKAIKRRSNPKYNRRVKECDVCAAYLLQVWLEQGGKCPLTGWRLTLPDNSSKRKDRSMKRASVDRIYNDKGYVKGNVRFIALVANYCRNSWSDEQVIEFGRAIANNNKGQDDD